MAEGLGEIAKHAFVMWVVFLGQQPDLIAKVKQTFEQLQGFSLAPE
jgi:hypothetical protein